MRKHSRQHRGSDVGNVASPKQEMDFSIYDRQRIAVSMRVGDEHKVFCGLATFQQDSLLGNVLRVALPTSSDAGNAQIILSQSQWSGRIIPDIHHGCVFLFIVNPADAC